MSDDDWGDEEKETPKVQYEMAEVIQDYIPTSNEHLTLIKYDLVYVMKKGADGFWEGETKGVYGKFPARYVRLVDETGKPKKK